MDWPITSIWIGAIIVLLIFEAITPQLVTIWFAFGALVSLIAHLLGAPLWLQGTLFVVVSTVALILTRPLVKKHLHNKKTPTNADRVIGCIGIVEIPIERDKATGTVKVNGSVWSAKSESDATIPADTKVLVKRIEGVKVIVEPQED